MNHLTNVKSHSTDQRSQKRPENDCGMEWKLNAAFIHYENRQKSSKVITATFSCVSSISSKFFLFLLCIMNWGTMKPSLAASLRFRDRMSDAKRLTRTISSDTRLGLDH